jgi:aspartate/methionine/tyrosine aminotransferase
MQDGSIPLDLAFCRWMAVEKGVMTMPCSLFYLGDSDYRSDKYIRVSISRGLDISTQALNQLKL